MISTDFLRDVTWQERWLQMVAEGEVDLPAFTGSTLRGALGAVMRPELCAGSAAGGGAVRAICGEVCEQPAACRFFSLFEQSRAAQGSGANQPKPLIQVAALGEPLAEIARGGPVVEPFELVAGEPVPTLRNDWRIGVKRGAVLSVGLRGLGAAGAALDGLAEGVRRNGLEVKGGRLRVVEVSGGERRLRLVESEAGCRRVRLHLLTPVMIRDGERTCHAPARLAELVLKQAVVRAVTVFNTFYARERLPFVEAAWPGVVFTGSRVFRYRIHRQSYRQERWMDFDGMVGWLEWEGAVGGLIPWLRAAEVWHVGQKATFGLGRVEVECL